MPRFLIPFLCKIKIAKFIHIFCELFTDNINNGNSNNNTFYTLGYISAFYKLLVYTLAVIQLQN